MRSDLIKKGFDKAPHRSLLRATGQIKDDGDFKKPFIGIANSYIDLIPGHVHLQEFGATAKNAVRLAGGVPFEFNTIGVDDGIAMGHIGMRYSLASRELIADSVETVAESHRLDGLICISNCDKIVPFPGSAKPSTSIKQFIELAVNIPEQEPHVGQPLSSKSLSSSSFICPALYLPTPSKTDTRSIFWPVSSTPAFIGPPDTKIVGILILKL